MAIPTTTTQLRNIEERHAALFAAFSHACLHNPSLLADIPDNSELALVPDDDPELAAYTIAHGTRSVDAGRNVYFRHVRIADFLPIGKRLSVTA